MQRGAFRATVGGLCVVSSCVLARSAQAGGERVAVTIHLRAAPEPFELAQLRGLLPEERRRSVMRALRGEAARSQIGVLDVLARAERAGLASDVRPLWIANVVAARIAPETARALAGLEEVESITADRPLPPPEGEPATPGGATGPRGVTCGLDSINAPGAWADGYTGAGVTVALIDTGVCLAHPDILGRIWTNGGEVPDNGIDDDGNGFVDDVHGWNFDAGNADVDDTAGRGSHIAGTIAGDGTSGTSCGVAPGTEIMVLKFRPDLTGESTVWAGIQYALENGADVVSGSLGWPHALGPDRGAWRRVCENAMAAGVVLVFTAGAEGSAHGIDSVVTPGDVPGMITVGAADCGMVIAGFSSRGPVSWQDVPPYHDWPYPPGKLKPTVVAPGVGTLSHDLCAGYTIYSGTSMAVPHVAGTVALMLSANPGLDHYQLKQILKESAADRGEPGADNAYGHGFIDARAAVQGALDAWCRADFNRDGAVSTLDVLAFLNAWASGSSDADINGDGSVDTLDVLAFLNLWTFGC